MRNYAIAAVIHPAYRNTDKGNPMTTSLSEMIDSATTAIRAKVEIAPKVGVILGTGLGNLAKAIKNGVSIPYSSIPNFPRSTVDSHAGNFIVGELGGVAVAVMEGRFHYYEGYSLAQVTFPVRVMKALGAEALVVTSASGSLNPLHRKGDIVVIDDHINLMGVNPLIGPNDDQLGMRFPDMCEPYCRAFVELIEALALREGIRVHKSVYAAMTGPTLETRAEYRMLRTIGADCIGMSTVPEVIVAVHAGLKVLGMTVLTDVCLPDALRPVELSEIIEVANQAGPKLEKLIMGFLENCGLR